MPGRSLRVVTWMMLVLAAVSLEAVPANDSRLADAAMRRDHESIRVLLREKVDVNAAQADGSTAVHWVVREGNVDLAQLLIRSGANINVTTRYGVTPIELACTSGNVSMIDALLRAGVDPNAANPGGETALMTAARIGNPDAVKLLLERGARVDTKEKMRGQTALMWAAIENHLDVARLLLAHGANVNAQTDVMVPDGMESSIARADGTQAMSANIGAAGPGVYRARAIPSPSGAMTPLLFAAREGNLEMARMLIAAKADLNLRSANGTAPLVVAIINNRIRLARYRLEAGADPNIADEYHKRPALFAAIEMRNLNFSSGNPATRSG